VLLTRAPLYSQTEVYFLVRLACVRHAASVDSEPGSNSRLILVCIAFRTEVRRLTMRLRSLEKGAEGITCENDSTKESHHLTTGTFNYVVKDPDCQRLSVQFWIKD
jgi:hypothetical protein